MEFIVFFCCCACFELHTLPNYFLKRDDFSSKKTDLKRVLKIIMQDQCVKINTGILLIDVYKSKRNTKQKPNKHRIFNKDKICVVDMLTFNRFVTSLISSRKFRAKALSWNCVYEIFVHNKWIHLEYNWPEFAIKILSYGKLSK